MNTTLYISRAGVFLPPCEEDAAAGLEAVRDTLPRAGARRMSRAGLAVKSALGAESPAPGDAMIYASVFGMTATLEDYLASFPHPSPLAFQNSIHPAGIEQVLVMEKRAVGEFFPVAGEERLLAIAALETIFRCVAPVRRLVGGEESGTWMSLAGCGNMRTFAYALTVSPDAEGAIGKIVRTDAAAPDAETPGQSEFVEAIAARRPLNIGTPDTAGFAISWA